MKPFLKQQIGLFIPKKYLKSIYRFFIQPKAYMQSYSQSGEDLILNTIFYDENRGTYIDIGANNPTIQSNTHFFYKKGWRGINIDALPGSMRPFKKIRPKDINLEIPISDKIEVLKYYMFSCSFFNTFSSEVVQNCGQKCINTIELKTEKLSNILDKYLVNNKIDFMTVDVEGWDLLVLKSNDWVKYRPKVVLIEYPVSNNPSEICTSEIGNYLIDKGYLFLCNTIAVYFFIDSFFYNERFGNGVTQSIQIK
jgi:FkbM family methyltransferase